MHTFFTTFRRSLSDKNLYREVAAGKHPLKLSYAVWLSAISAVAICIIMVVMLYAVAIPGGKLFVNTQIPADLILTLKSGKLSINQPVPYRFELPKDDREDGKVNFLVIDTSAEATLDSTAKYETMVFVNDDTVIMEKSSSEIRAYPLKDIPDFTFSRDITNDFLNKAVSYAWIIPIAAFIPIMLFSFVGLLIVYVFAGFVLWLIMKIASRTILFKDAFIISMYAYTFIFILDLAFMFVAGGFGFILSVLLTALIGTIFLFMKDTHSPEINETQ